MLFSRRIWLLRITLIAAILSVAAYMFIRAGSVNPATGHGDSLAVLSEVRLPPGFKMKLFATGITDARSMTRGKNGTLFVGTRQAGKVYAVVDANDDKTADRVYTIAENLYMPCGVAFRGDSLYVAEVNRVLRYDDIENSLASPPLPIVINDSFPSDAAHGWKFIRFGPDGKLYVPVGAPCNVCENSDARYSSIMRMNPDGTQLEIFAAGIRNTVGFDWHPETGQLWFTDNGRDWLGDNLPPDELNCASAPGLHFGFPYFHGRQIPDPEFAGGRNPASFVPCIQELGAHVAAIGMRFYTGRMFPEKYHGQIFIAEHGSWNRKKKSGYRISLVTLENGHPTSYKAFAEGFEKDDHVSGRPVDIEQLDDGSLLISDDFSHAIYRISYEP